MKNERTLRLDELTTNPSARVPICLALDVSSSMRGSKLDELNRALALFYQSIHEDEVAQSSAEIAIVTFGDRVSKVLDFASIERQIPPHLHAQGNTPMGQAVNLSLDLLEQAKRMYSELGVDYFQPWLVLMTDGAPTDEISRAVQRCTTMVQNRKLTVFPIAIGADANLAQMAAFSPNIAPLRIESGQLRQFFSWLSKSIATVSLSNPGDRAAANYGESEFQRMSMDWQSAVTGRS
jgi:uncharacterized protein YegL